MTCPVLHGHAQEQKGNAKVKGVPGPGSQIFGMPAQTCTRLIVIYFRPPVQHGRNTPNAVGGGGDRSAHGGLHCRLGQRGSSAGGAFGQKAVHHPLRTIPSLPSLFDPMSLVGGDYDGG